MFARVEVSIHPELVDSVAQSLLRKIELSCPALFGQIRWIRMLEVYWIDIAVSREELILAIASVCWDPVLQWVFTGNLMPSAAGKMGGLQDLMQYAPHRPGKFWGIERRFRPGVTDHIGNILREAFQIVLGKETIEMHAASGGLLLLEGPALDEESLTTIACQVFCNDLIETWTLVSEEGLKKNERFHRERIKYDLPKILIRGSDTVETFSLKNVTDEELQKFSKQKILALSLPELHAIRNYFEDTHEKKYRENIGLNDMTDVEIEVLAQTWSEHCKHKIFNASIDYVDSSHQSPVDPIAIPNKIDGLFQEVIAGTTEKIQKPWLLSAFTDNAGICALDDEDAFCMKVETHNAPSALDPYGGALTGIVGVNRDILGCGLGALPIFNTNVFCVAPLDHEDVLPERILHPRRILDGVRLGVEHGGNKSGIPTINGALVFHPDYLGKPLIYCGTAGIMPRKSAGQPCEIKTVLSGDRVCMVGGGIGKDGLHGATFSSLSFEEESLTSTMTSPVQLGDPLTQKRVAQFLLEARDLGLYRAITDNGAGGLSSSVGEMALLSGGVSIDVSRAHTKYPGLKPYELVVSESQERMTLAVIPEKISDFFALAKRRGVEVSDLGEFTNSGRFEIYYSGKIVASLRLDFLHHGVPRLHLQAEWKGRPPEPTSTAPQLSCHSFESEGGSVLLHLLSQPVVASKEWLIRQYDHEVQGMSVIKPLHTVFVGTSQARSGPNDAGVIKPKLNSDLGIVVGCGIQPKLSAIDPLLMAQASVDEAVRNVLCVGAEFGGPDSVLALIDNFCWPDPVEDVLKMGALVRAGYGLHHAALALSIPLISGKDSMKNDFRGKKQGVPIQISVPPTLLMTAVGRVIDIRQARTADFKSVGDMIYILGPGEFGLLGSEFYQMYSKKISFNQASDNPSHSVDESFRVGEPNWETANLLYSWLGGAIGKNQSYLKSVHDVSDGGLLVAVAESLIARGFGSILYFPNDCNVWEFAFGEGFHTFVVSIAEVDRPLVEFEWKKFGISFRWLGIVDHHERLEVFKTEDDLEGARSILTVPVSQLQAAWLKEGYWE